MLVLGLLLILGAAVITAGAFFDAGETATVEVLGQTSTTTAAGVFVIGALDHARLPARRLAAPWPP